MKSRIFTGILAVSAVILIFGCKSNIDQHEHDFKAGTVVAPTHESDGYTVYTCSCGEEEHRDTTAKIPHEFVKGTTVAPTCASEGYTVYTCSCGKEEHRDTTAKLAHDFGKNKPSCINGCGTANPDFDPICNDEVKISAMNMYIGKYEVTRGYLKSVLGDDADVSYAWGGTASDGDARPADNVTEATAKKFCNTLSEQKGLDPYYDSTGAIISASGKGYRLLTKDEWETAAKAGTSYKYAGTDGVLAYSGLTIDQWILDDSDTDSSNWSVTQTQVTEASIANAGDEELAKYAWTKYNIRTGSLEDLSKFPQPKSVNDFKEYTCTVDGVEYTLNKNSYGQPHIRWSDGKYWGTHAVGEKLPNAYELYDMTGNVSEMVQTDAGVTFVGGDIGSNTAKIQIAGANSYETKVKGFRICRNF